MNRDTETGRDLGGFSSRRAALIMLVAIAIIAVGSWMARAHPISAYRAGYEVAIGKGEGWIRAHVEETGGQSSAVCDELLNQSEQSEMTPRYDHRSFVKGCRDAVDDLYGHRVPLRN